MTPPRATTPMMEQYLGVKAKYPDTLLLYRMGDFYETFYEDAVTLSRVLGIALTSRSPGDAEKIPLAGIPWHSAEPQIARLLHAGTQGGDLRAGRERGRSEGAHRPPRRRGPEPGNRGHRSALGGESTQLPRRAVRRPTAGSAWRRPTSRPARSWRAT